MRKRARSGTEMETDEETYIPVNPEVVPPEVQRKPRRKLQPAPIENVNEFDIAQYISDLPCGLTIGQAAAQIPKYRGGLAKSIRRTRKTEANYVSNDHSSHTTAVRCNFHVDGVPVSVVIDSGAATSIMTHKLMKKLGYTIDRPSDLVVVTANGSKVHSLGQVTSLALEVKNATIETPVQILDSTDEVFILGNDWLRRMKATLDWDNGELSIKYGRKIMTIPIICTRKCPLQDSDDEETDEDSDEYEDEEYQEVPIYFSDSSDDDLEFNPWKDYVSPPPSDEEEEKEDDVENPAIYLAQVQPEEAPQNSVDLNLGPLDAHQQTLFTNLLKEYKDLCAKSQTEIGRTDLVKHQIITGEAVPIAQQPYRVNPKNRDFLKQEIAKMETQGIIRKSSSPWASPVVIVEKKDNTRRICVDYRKLNAVTKADVYPLPRVDDLLESFRGANWFTTLDLASGYWQVAMHPNDIEKTAFITPFGLYEFLVMPFGLGWAPGTFQRLMNRVLQDFLGEFVAVYLDDIIIYSKGSFENHLDHLKQVFNALQQSFLKIKLKKCHFCLPNIKFLGHVVG